MQLKSINHEADEDFAFSNEGLEDWNKDQGGE